MPAHLEQPQFDTKGRCYNCREAGHSRADCLRAHDPKPQPPAGAVLRQIADEIEADDG